MASTVASLTLFSWLRLPRRTARLRLTLFYGGLFLVSGARSGQGQGHGLGLAIVKAVVVAHNATITTRARPEGGLAVEVGFRATVPVPDEKTGVERQLEPATG
jgi:nitrogen-specific signal transduction histidine kinase